MNDLKKMLEELFPQSEDAITDRAVGMLFPDGDTSKDPQYNLTELIREANMSPKEYDRFIDLVLKNKFVNRGTGDPDEVYRIRSSKRERDVTIRNIFSRALNPDNRIGESKLPYNTKRRGFENDYGVMQSLAMILGGRESRPSLEKSPRSKSIDDILRESDLVEVLSKSDRDATNVDVTRQKNMESSTVEELLKMFGDSNQLDRNFNEITFSTNARAITS